MHPPLKQSRAGANFFMTQPNNMSKLDIQRMLINDKRHFSQSHDSDPCRCTLWFRFEQQSRPQGRVGGLEEKHSAKGHQNENCLLASKFEEKFYGEKKKL